jgi:hypothetical protein
MEELLHNFINITSDVKRCHETMYEVLKICNNNIEIRIIKEEYEDNNKNKSYARYVLDSINYELDEYSICGVCLENGNGGVSDQTFNHCFVLYKIGTKIYRIESYVDIYSVRMMETPSYEQDLYKLITCNFGGKRLDLWNNLFGSNEKIDTDLPLDVELHIIH